MAKLTSHCFNWNNTMLIIIVVAIMILVSPLLLFYAISFDGLISYQNLFQNYFTYWQINNLSNPEYNSRVTHSIDSNVKPLLFNPQNKTIDDNNQNKDRSSWMNEYNRDKLRADLSGTFIEYTKRFDRIRPRTQSMISIENMTVLYHPQFNNANIGPIISYWICRMMSFFSQFYDFKLVLSPTANDGTYHEQNRAYKMFFDTDHYFAFLPKQINDFHAIDVDYNSYLKYQDWILFWMFAKRKKPKFGWEHMDLMFSKIFTDVIRHETNDAFDKYYKFNQIQDQQKLIKDMWISKSDDVLIHIRCQDVLSMKAPTDGMNSLNYYNHAIRNVFNINVHENMAIHIVLYLGDIAGCNEYLYEYLLPSFKKIFYPSQIKLIINGTVNNDLYRITQAPNIICGANSYCLMGAVANRNNVVLYKGWTPQTWNEYGKYDPFAPIADNIHLIEDPYFVLSQTIYKQKWNVSQIANVTMRINETFLFNPKKTL